MPEPVERPPDPADASRPPSLAPLIAVAGAALVDMGVAEPSDTLLLPTARALHSLAPHTDASHVRPD